MTSTVISLFVLPRVDSEAAPGGTSAGPEIFYEISVFVARNPQLIMPHRAIGIIISDIKCLKMWRRLVIKISVLEKCGIIFPTLKQHYEASKVSKPFRRTKVAISRIIWIYD